MCLENKHGVWMGPYLVALGHGGGLQLQGRVRLSCTDTHSRHPLSDRSHRLAGPHRGDDPHVSTLHRYEYIHVRMCIHHYKLALGRFPTCVGDASEEVLLRLTPPPQEGPWEGPPPWHLHV